MPIITHSISDKDTPVLLFPPNWRDPVLLTISIDTYSEEDVAGKRTQRLRHSVPRLTQHYTCLLSGAEAAELRQHLATAGATLRAAVPIWPDKRFSSNWGSRYFTAQRAIQWDPVGATSILSGSPTSGNEVAPLLIGRLRRHPIRMITDNLFAFVVEVEEDSPWEERIAPAVAVGTETEWDAVAWPWDWSDDPHEGATDALTEQVIGDGRLLSTGGTASVPRIWQSGQVYLQGVALRRFIRFWVDHQVARWTFPFASIARPGLSPGHVQVFSSVRIDPSPLQLRFEHVPDIAVAKLRIEDATNWDALPGSADFFEFSRNGTVFARLTNWENSFNNLGGGHTWHPARITHEGITSSLDLARDAARIRIDLDDLPDLGLGITNQHGILARLFLFESEHPITVRILRRPDLVAGGAPLVLYSGRVVAPRLKQNVLSADLQHLGGYLERQVPSWKITTTCNYAFLDAGCRLLAPGAMSVSTWTTTGTLKPVPGQPRKVRILGHTTPHAPSGATVLPSQANYWTDGTFRAGSGATVITRIITGSTQVSGSVIELELDRPVDWDMAPEDSTASLVPGCDGAYATCRAKFQNDAAFGGCPNLPEYIDTTAPGGPVKGGK